MHKLHTSCLKPHGIAVGLWGALGSSGLFQTLHLGSSGLFQTLHQDISAVFPALCAVFEAATDGMIDDGLGDPLDLTP